MSLYNELILKNMKKTYVLDTNVLLSDPNFFRNFEDNDLVIPILVLEELDKIGRAHV